MSEVKVNKISPRSGTAITLGDSGDTFTIPSGATLAIAGSVTGFTSAGIDDNATSVAITIDSSERVGIGNTSPTGALDVKSGTQPQLKVATASATADRNAGFLVTASNSATPGSRSVVVSLDADGGDGSGTDNLTITKTGGDGDATITNQNNANLIFGTNNAEQMRLSSTGLGIGTSAPTQKLEVIGRILINEQSGNGTFIIDGSATSSSQIRFSQGGTAKGYLTYWDSSDTLGLTDGSASGLHFSPSTGKVGIGTSAPTSLLSLEASSPDIMFTDTSGGTDSKKWRVFGLDSDFRIGCRNDANSSGQTALQIDRSGATITNFIFNTGGSERMRIDSSGDVGIGTTTPDGKVDIAAAQTTSNKFTDPHLALTATSQSNSDGFTGISYAAATITNYGWTVGATRSSGGDGSSHFTFRNHYNSASGTEKVRIDSGGRLIVGATSSSTLFHVEGDATVTGGIRLGGTGTANELDDYEEGTWTPGLSVSSSGNSGTYTKIGNLVFARFKVIPTGSGTNVNITGLPFTSTGATTGEQQGGSRETETSGKFYFIRVSNSSTSATIIRYDANVTVDGTMTFEGQAIYLTS